MLVTVTTTTQNLYDDILSTAQKKVAEANTSGGRPTFLGIQNLGAQDIYLETFDTAGVATGTKILAATGVISLPLGNLHVINLISDGGNNADVRILFTL